MDSHRCSLPTPCSTLRPKGPSINVMRTLGFYIAKY